ncbi:dephospho-CoA kinase [Marinobacter gelidimuriae]|uniref:dephospho-CoA kinase n=1 Tax=Marinobacter gelidimuriae TaxID=2739064 RepID=UPI00037A4D71|nr:dephospho-CoA kinase [Marinobacter gelidimuriae]
MAPKIVGLTGGIGSGKSMVASLFGAFGVHWVDADDVARQVVEPGTRALELIAQHFGHDILTSGGALNRAALRKLVFDDADERRWLEELIHPIIHTELERQLKPDDYNLPYVLLVSPLLFETIQHTMTERVIVIDSPESVQIQRTMARDNNPRDQVKRIIAAQIPRQQRLDKADLIIDNGGTKDNVRQQVRDAHNALLVEFGH